MVEISKDGQIVWLTDDQEVVIGPRVLGQIVSIENSRGRDRAVGAKPEKGCNLRCGLPGFQIIMRQDKRR